MLFSDLGMDFIILATAATLFKTGKTDIATATDAAEALRPIVGDASGTLVVGPVGAGGLAVPILTGSAAYAISEAFGWRYGLDRKPARAKQFYAVIIAATLVGMLINFVGISPISALVYTAMLNGLLAPPLMIVTMLVSMNAAVMGDRVNGGISTTLGWAATLIMLVAAAALFIFR